MNIFKYLFGNNKSKRGYTDNGLFEKDMMEKTHEHDMIMPIYKGYFISKEAIKTLGFKLNPLRSNTYYLKVNECTLLWVDTAGLRPTVFSEDIEDNDQIIYPNLTTIYQLEQLIKMF